MRSDRVAIVGALVANVVPLVGVASYGWNIYSLLVIYWVESGVVGLVTVGKIKRAEGADDPEYVPEMSTPGRTARSLVGAPNREVVSFFVTFYGVFWLTHGLFLFVVVPPMLGTESVNGRGVVVATIALCISHTVSYRLGYVGGAAYERAGPVTVMAEPTDRLMVLHVTIVLGGIVVAILGLPIIALVVMMVAKTIVDFSERDRTGQRPRPAEHRTGP